MRNFRRLAALLAVLAGCGTAAQEPAGARLELGACRISAGPGYPGIKAECGTLLRPLDPAEPAGKAIELAVAVVPALSLEPERSPLVPIAGGPGQSTVEFFAAYANAFEPIRRSRDIVLLDQRGTGDSAPLDCPAGEDPLAAEQTPEAAAREARRCLDDLAHDPRFFTTSVAVTDLEALRQALGVPAFNLYGISYGTRVAQHYARRYPQATRTVILDGVVPPQVALGPAIATEAQRALEAIFARCAGSPPCAEKFPGIVAEFKSLQERLAMSTVAVSIPDPLTGREETFPFGDSALAGALRLLSYHPSTVALMPLLIHEAFNENYGPLAAQYLMSARSIGEALSLGMHNAVVCTEDAPFFEHEGVTREDRESTYIGALQLDALEAMCAVWPRGVMDEDLRERLDTDVPVLLLSGEADPITPPRFAELAAVGMSRSLELTGEDQGHGQLTRACIPGIMAEFVDTAAFATLETECLERQFAMPFFLDFTGPAP